jgi:hypothetical protein
VQRNLSLKAHGGMGSSWEIYQQLHVSVRTLVDMAGFGRFIPTLTSTQHDHAVVTALAERWRDSTSSFHLVIGEATMTPLDFSAITGLRVGGVPIPFDSGIGGDDAALKWFLGFKPNKEGETATYGQFKLKGLGEPTDEVDAAQKARCYLLYLFGASLYPNRRNRVHLSYLGGLRDFTVAARYNWGGAALGSCYAFMNAVSRRKGTSISGLWSVWEVKHKCF